MLKKILLIFLTLNCLGISNLVISCEYQRHIYSQLYYEYQDTNIQAYVNKTIYDPYFIITNFDDDKKMKIKVANNEMLDVYLDANKHLFYTGKKVGITQVTFTVDEMELTLVFNIDHFDNHQTTNWENDFQYRNFKKINFNNIDIEKFKELILEKNEHLKLKKDDLIIKFDRHYQTKPYTYAYVFLNNYQNYYGKPIKIIFEGIYE